MLGKRLKITRNNVVTVMWIGDSFHPCQLAITNESSVPHWVPEEQILSTFRSSRIILCTVATRTTKYLLIVIIDTQRS